MSRWEYDCNVMSRERGWFEATNSRFEAESRAWVFSSSPLFCKVVIFSLVALFHYFYKVVFYTHQARHILPFLWLPKPFFPTCLYPFPWDQYCGRIYVCMCKCSHIKPIFAFSVADNLGEWKTERPLTQWSLTYPPSRPLHHMYACMCKYVCY